MIDNMNRINCRFTVFVDGRNVEVTTGKVKAKETEINRGRQRSHILAVEEAS